MTHIWSSRVRADVKDELGKMRDKAIITENDVDAVIRIFERVLKSNENEDDSVY